MAIKPWPMVITRRSEAPEMSTIASSVSIQPGSRSTCVDRVAPQEKTTHIGRGLTADIRIDDHRVSRLHASISQGPGGARVLDGRSLNGTFVNGQQVVWAELRHGDVIVLGPITMRYVEVPGETCSAAGRVTRLTRGFARTTR